MRRVFILLELGACSWEGCQQVWWWCVFYLLVLISRGSDCNLSLGHPFVLSDHYGSDLWLCRGNKRSNKDSNVIPVDGTDETAQEKML